MARHNDVRLAATYDQTLSDSDNIEDFTPTSGETFNIPGVGEVYCGVSTMPSYTAGQAIYDASGGVSYIGYPQSRYTQPMMHVDTLSWLRTNYEGQVTAYIRTDGTTYARYNCQLRLQETNLQNRPDWKQVTWIFTIIEAL
jgi:hypothetical protein